MHPIIYIRCKRKTLYVPERWCCLSDLEPRHLSAFDGSIGVFVCGMMGKLHESYDLYIMPKDPFI